MEWKELPGTNKAAYLDFFHGGKHYTIFRATVLGQDHYTAIYAGRHDGVALASSTTLSGLFESLGIAPKKLELFTDPDANPLTSFGRDDPFTDELMEGIYPDT